MLDILFPFFQILGDAKTYFKGHESIIKAKLHQTGNPMIDPFNEIRAVFRWPELLTNLKSVYYQKLFCLRTSRHSIT